MMVTSWYMNWDCIDLYSIDVSHCLLVVLSPLFWMFLSYYHFHQHYLLYNLSNNDKNIMDCQLIKLNIKSIN